MILNILNKSLTYSIRKPYQDYNKSWRHCARNTRASRLRMRPSKFRARNKPSQ